MDLFSSSTKNANGTPAVVNAPLAVRMRPRDISEVVGQEQLLQAGQPLYRLLSADESSVPSSVFLWGAPGIGKTTLAYLCANSANRNFVEISAVSSGVKELREVIEEAKNDLYLRGKETVLFIDEVHRFSKSQQDALLPAVENRWVILIAATTENPSFSVISPLLSRSLLLTLQPLSAENIAEILRRALADERGFNGEVTISEEAFAAIVRLAGADGRRALTILEAAGGDSPKEITLAQVQAAVDSYAVRYDRQGDQHYNVISAFIKSLRGSDVDAGLHYLARMLEAGEDPRFIARRLMILASEDVGMADPHALIQATAAAQAVALVGMPEARIILAQAVTYLATAPKSNAVYVGINRALAEVKQGDIGQVPVHLWDKSVHSSRVAAKNTGLDKPYIYAHDEPQNIACQTYLPEVLKDHIYYEPTGNGHERNITQRLELIRKALGRKKC